MILHGSSLKGQPGLSQTFAEMREIGLIFEWKSAMQVPLPPLWPPTWEMDHLAFGYLKKLLKRLRRLSGAAYVCIARRKPDVDFIV